MSARQGMFFSLADGGSVRATGLIVEIRSGAGSTTTVPMSDINIVSHTDAALRLGCSSRNIDLAMDSVADASGLERFIQSAQTAPPPPPSEHRTTWIAIGSIVIAVLIVGYWIGIGRSSPDSKPAGAATSATQPSQQSTCSTHDGKKVVTLLDSFAQEWDDAMKLAQSSPRIQLAPQIDHLQTIRRNVTNQEWPSCATQPKDALLTAMDAAIDGFLSFMASDTDVIVQGHFSDYSKYLSQFTAEMTKLR